MEYDEFQVGTTYLTKICDKWTFTIHRIELNSKGDRIVKFWGVHTNSPELLNCPLDPERLISPLGKPIVTKEIIQKFLNKEFDSEMSSDDFEELKKIVREFIAKKKKK